jgi:DNA-binding transcriptional ArsR family regulator
VSASVYGLIFRAKIGNPTLKLVLLALADNANDNGYCYPGIDHLIQKTELSKRQVLRYLDKLEEAGLMRRESGIGRGHTSEFFLDLTAIQEKVSYVTPIQNKKVSSKARKGVIQDVKGDIFDTYKEETSETSLETTLLPFGEATTKVEPSKPSLHGIVTKHIQTLYQSKFGDKCPWDGSEAGQLRKLIEGNPSWQFSTFERLIKARYDSEGVNGERPRTWIAHLSKYMAGPLDRFGKTKTDSPPAVERRVLTASERMARSAGMGR